MTESWRFGVHWSAEVLLRKSGVRADLTLREVESTFMIAIDWNTYLTLTTKSDMSPEEARRVGHALLPPHAARVTPDVTYCSERHAVIGTSKTVGASLAQRLRGGSLEGLEVFDAGGVASVAARERYEIQIGQVESRNAGRSLELREPFEDRVFLVAQNDDQDRQAQPVPRSRSTGPRTETIRRNGRRPR